jgi:hypothetical protein
MSESPEPSRAEPGGISMRTMEIATALFFLAVGSLVVYDSHRLGSSWGSDGPEAGYFPFYIGMLMCISSVVILCQAIWGRNARRSGVFVEWQPLRQVMAVLLPALVFVLGIQGFMRWLGKYGWVKSVLLGAAVAAAAFATFEIWFQVPLYKGAFDPLSRLGY